MEQRYAKYKEIVGDLQRQLEESKRRIQEYRVCDFIVLPTMHQAWYHCIRRIFAVISLYFVVISFNFFSSFFPVFVLFWLKDRTHVKRLGQILMKGAI